MFYYTIANIGVYKICSNISFVGRAAGHTFQESELLSNPVVGLMIGVLVTVVVQSSSTSSSIVIAMVASGMLDVPHAIYIIMGKRKSATIKNTTNLPMSKIYLFTK